MSWKDNELYDDDGNTFSSTIREHPLAHMSQAIQDEYDAAYIRKLAATPTRFYHYPRYWWRSLQLYWITRG